MLNIVCSLKISDTHISIQLFSNKVGAFHLIIYLDYQNVSSNKGKQIGGTVRQMDVRVKVNIKLEVQTGEWFPRCLGASTKPISHFATRPFCFSLDSMNKRAVQLPKKTAFFVLRIKPGQFQSINLLAYLYHTCTICVRKFLEDFHRKIYYSRRPHNRTLPSDLQMNNNPDPQYTFLQFVLGFESYL